MRQWLGFGVLLSVSAYCAESLAADTSTSANETAPTTAAQAMPPAPPAATPPKPAAPAPGPEGLADPPPEQRTPEAPTRGPAPADSAAQVAVENEHAGEPEARQEQAQTKPKLRVATAAAQKPAAEPPSVHTHDGFFLRLGTGFAPWSETIRPKHKASTRPNRVDTTGIAKIDDIALGYSISRHWVLALNLQSADLLASTSRGAEETPLPAELDPGVRKLGLLGINALWFSNPKGGFNLGGGLALGAISVNGLDDEGLFPKPRYGAGGLALTVEVGHTFWISEQWSVGLRGRLNAGGFAGKDDTDTEWTHSLSIAPGAMFDIMYH